MSAPPTALEALEALDTDVRVANKTLRRELAKTFSFRLREARQLAELTQEGLAKLAGGGINQVHVGRFEAGRSCPNLTSVVRFARALNVSTDYLCGIADFPEIT